ncbi:Lar family restriction alleviation protein (plasmid) [Citrobacter freundii]|nr:Lar family restriction alleviation protein [Citrobacter freundii]QLV95596.1 Lar family restriction alleviation protein [Citrobacter freundii]
MPKITRERLLKIQSWRETYGPGSNIVLPAEEAEELARIALASLYAKPIGEVVEIGPALIADFYGQVTRGDKLYAAPPAPVMPDVVNGLMPCPFCGGKARQLTIEQDNDPHFGGDVITCTECGASSHVEFGFKENLKAAWNSRAFMLQFGNSPVSPGIWTEKVLDTNKDNRESEDVDHE